MKNDYKVGDHIINKHTKQVFVIVYVYKSSRHIQGLNVQTKDTEILNFNKQELNKYKHLDINCPVAQVLYTNNSNKGEQNENNEK